MDVLYHASTNKELELLKPQRTLSKDVYIGDYVFASSDKRLAAMYLATRGVPALLNVIDEKPAIVIASAAEDYLKNDKGGAIYTVPAATFKATPQTELEDSELVSNVAVKPLSKTIYESSIAAMQEMGVAIYFVRQAVFDELVSTKQEAKIIAGLTPY